MTKEEKIEAFSMKLNGASYQEVADHFGVSRQYIHQLFPHAGCDDKSIYKKSIYKNLANYIKKNYKNASHFAKCCGITQTGISMILRGKNNPSKNTIDKILEVTGMTYEECFATEKKEELYASELKRESRAESSI